MQNIEQGLQKTAKGFPLPRILQRLLGLDLAIICSLIGALGCVALAFLNSEKAIAFMNRPIPCTLAVVSAFLLTHCAIHALLHKRFSSALVHAGAVLVAIGWLWGHLPIAFDLHGEERLPDTGMMPLVDGDESNILCGGRTLQEILGRLPFSVRLEKFIVEYYPDGSIQEYRSRVTITEPDKEPYVRNIRVNHPIRVGDYDIYQMSWGRTRDPMTGEELTYTILQFIRAPGLYLVYAGYLVLILGLLACTYCSFSRKLPAGTKDLS